MTFSSDERAQSVWIGFLLLLFVLVLLFTMYQTRVIPNQVAEVELQHEQEMTERMGTIRDRLYLVGVDGGTQSITFDPSPDYPARLIALNPPPPTGELTTRSRGNVSLEVDGQQTNLSAACGYGDETIPSRELAFGVDYNEYQQGSTIVYSHSVLYKQTDGTNLLVENHQSIVRNDSITIRPISNAYASASTAPISLQLVGGPVGSIAINASDSVSLTIPTQLPAAKWETLLADQGNVRDVVQSTDSSVSIVLAPKPYTVSCYGVGLGQAPPSGKRALSGS